MSRRYFGAAAAALALAGCCLAPAIAQVNAQTPAPVSGVATAPYVPKDKDERGLWQAMDESERELKRSNFVERDPALNKYVHDVMCRTIGPDCAQLRLYIVRTPYFNAEMSPNGMMQVWTGLFLRLHNEAQLAAILGHEYVHYKNQHSLKEFRDARAKSGAAMFMAFVPFAGAFLVLGELSSIFSYSREMEAEADSESLPLITNAGYQPIQASKIWEQIRAEQDATAEARKTKSRKDKNGGIFATHPPSAERLAMLKTLAEKYPADDSRVVGRETYRAALDHLWPKLIDDQIKMNDFGGTQFLLDNLAQDNWTADLYYARGELFRSRGLQSDLAVAEDSYRHSIAGPDAPAEAWRGLGLTLMKENKADEARMQLKEYLKRKADAPDRALIAMMAEG